MANSRIDLGSVPIDDAQKKILVEQFAHFFEDETSERLGIFQSEAMVEFFIEQLAPIAYNMGLDHAKQWYQKQMESLDIEFDMLYRQLR